MKYLTEYDFSKKIQAFIIFLWKIPTFEFEVTNTLSNTWQTFINIKNVYTYNRYSFTVLFNLIKNLSSPDHRKKNFQYYNELIQLKIIFKLLYTTKVCIDVS